LRFCSLSARARLSRSLYCAERPPGASSAATIGPAPGRDALITCGVEATSDSGTTTSPPPISSSSESSSLLMNMADGAAGQD